jgi:hypothetical protein
MGGGKFHNLVENSTGFPQHSVRHFQGFVLGMDKGQSQPSHNPATICAQDTNLRKSALFWSMDKKEGI